MSTLWHMTVSGAVLIAAIVCLRSLFLEKLDKGVFPALWLVAAVRLLVPVSLPVPVPAQALELLPAAAVAPAQGTASAGGGFPWLTALWLAGALTAAAVMLLRHVRSLRQYAQALPVRNEQIDALVAGFDLRRTVSVRVCQTVSTPLTYGFLRPVILLPKGWERYGRQELELVLTHELCHIRRLDVPVKYILTAAACVHWFDPFVWVMYALAERDIELACDEAVLRRTTDGRAAYAMALIGLEERRGPDMLLSGFGLRAVRERVTEIMQYRRRGLCSFLAGAAIVVCSLTVFATAAAAYDAEPLPTPTPSPVLQEGGSLPIPDRGTPPPAGTLPERAVEGGEPVLPTPSPVPAMPSPTPAPIPVTPAPMQQAAPTAAPMPQAGTVTVPPTPEP